MPKRNIRLPESRVLEERLLNRVSSLGRNPMFHETAVFLYSITTGFACSGIVANLYHLLNGKKDRLGRSVYLATIIVAGPSEFFERSAKARHEKNCSWIAFLLAVA